MLIKRPHDIAPSEITPPTVYARRREFLKTSALLAASAVLGVSRDQAHAGSRFADVRPSPYSVLEKPNSYKDITSYNNFSEFGFDKSDPAERAPRMKTRPWSVSIEGLVQKPRTLAIEDILKLAPLEERIYRLRCVETWSMVVPWVGFPLARLLKQVEPLSSAKYVAFTTLMDQEQFPGQKSPFYPWPYTEGLRLDEAMHRLTTIRRRIIGARSRSSVRLGALAPSTTARPGATTGRIHNQVASGNTAIRRNAAR